MTTKINQLLGVGFLIVLIAYLVFQHQELTHHQTEINRYTQQVKQLEHSNDSLHHLNTALDTKVVQLTHQTDSLTHLVDLEKIAIENLKKLHHEKISSIRHYTTDELIQFFAKPHPQSSPD